MQSHLKIPWAWENSEPIFPQSAESRRMYKCPNCRRYVFLRAGKIKRHHFAHQMRDSSCNPTPETIEHLIAKGMLFRSLTGNSPEITVNNRWGCQCGQDHSKHGILNSRLGKAYMEYTFESSSGNRLRADLAVLKNAGSIRFLIEVRATSKVSEEKSHVLREEKIPWIEVSAAYITGDSTDLNDVPVIASGNLNPRKCLLVEHPHVWTELNEGGVRKCMECAQLEAPIMTKPHSQTVETCTCQACKPVRNPDCRKYGHTLPEYDEISLSWDYYETQCSRCKMTFSTRGLTEKI